MVEYVNDSDILTYWGKVKKISEDKISGINSVPGEELRSLSYDICLLKHASEIVRRLIRQVEVKIGEIFFIKSNLEEFISKFVAIDGNIKELYRDGMPMFVMANNNIRLKSVKIYRKNDVFKHSIYKIIRRRLNQIQESITEEVIVIIKSDRNCTLNTAPVEKVFNLFEKYKIQKYITDKVIEALIALYLEEVYNDDKGKYIMNVYKLIQKEENNQYLKGFYKELEKKFLKRAINWPIETIFEAKTKNISVSLASLFYKANGHKLFINKLQNFISSYKVVDFNSIHHVSNCLECVQIVIKQNKKDIFEKTYKQLINENMSIIIPEIEEVMKKIISDSFSAIEVDEYTLTLAKIFKFLDSKERFEAVFIPKIIDILLLGLFKYVENFIAKAKLIEINRNLTFKIETMLEEAINTVKMSGDGFTTEIFLARACYWPKYDETDLLIHDFDEIKNQFITEKKKENSKINIKFIDAISQCMIRIAGVELKVTLLQLKILKVIIDKEIINASLLKRKINHSQFEEHFKQLLDLSIVIGDYKGYKITASLKECDVLPKQYCSLTNSSEMKVGKSLEDPEARENFIDCEIMGIMKKEKKFNRTVLCRKLKVKLEIFNNCIDGLISKGYIEADGHNLFYIP